MKTGYVYLNNSLFPTILAISAEEQANGLMYQEWPPPVMSFVYSSPQLNRFWMKNTPSPLDIIFCCNGEIKEMCAGEPHSTTALGSVTSDLVIELPRGTVDLIGLKVGHKVGLVSPTISEILKK